MKDNVNSWIEAYTSEMISWTMHKISDAETAKDIVQDTFFAVVKGMKTFNRESKPKTWIFSILNRKIADYYREKYKQPVKAEFEDFAHFFSENGEWLPDKQPKDLNDNHTKLLDDYEFRKVLKACIENLPDKWEVLIKLKYLDEKESSKICQELEISPTNMWQIMHRAKLRLRECLEYNWFRT